MEFSARYPTTNLHVEYMRPDKIYDAVRDDIADLGLVSYPISSREIAAIRRFQKINRVPDDQAANGIVIIAPAIGLPHEFRRGFSAAGGRWRVASGG